MSTVKLKPDLTRKEHELASQQARAHLNKIFVDNGNKESGEYDPNIADQDGIVQYINATTNEPPPELVEERKKVAAVLEGLTGVITAAVLATAGSDDKAKQDPDVWADPVKYGLKPFISGVSIEETTYNREVVGIEVATQFLNILIDAVAGEGGALSSFRKFLEGQGETIRIEGSNTQEGYKFACIGMVHELFQIEGGQWIYVPKMKMYFTEFTRETFKINLLCASMEKVKFNFKVKKIVAPFKIETWRQNDWFRDDVDKFIKDMTQANLKESTNYFDGIFKSKK
jgi:hypothetical protein